MFGCPFIYNCMEVSDGIGPIHSHSNEYYSIKISPCRFELDRNSFENVYSKTSIGFGSASFTVFGSTRRSFTGAQCCPGINYNLSPLNADAHSPVECCHQIVWNRQCFHGSQKHCHTSTFAKWISNVRNNHQIRMTASFNDSLFCSQTARTTFVWIESQPTSKLSVQDTHFLQSHSMNLENLNAFFDMSHS